MSTEHRLTLSSSNAHRFVVVIGVVNLFADMTYEGGRSVTGPFLQMLGDSAAVIPLERAVATARPGLTKARGMLGC